MFKLLTVGATLCIASQAVLLREEGNTEVDGVPIEDEDLKVKLHKAVKDEETARADLAKAQAMWGQQIQNAKQKINMMQAEWNEAMAERKRVEAEAKKAMIERSTAKSAPLTSPLLFGDATPTVASEGGDATEAQARKTSL